MNKILVILAKIAAFVQGHKTYMLATAGICGAWYAYLMGIDPNLKDAIDATWAALAAAFIRHGVTTEAAK